jgi:hypothetical protein
VNPKHSVPKDGMGFLFPYESKVALVATNMEESHYKIIRKHTLGGTKGFSKN